VLPDILAFSGTTTRPAITVSAVTVTSPKDVYSLADLRYDEWIADVDAILITDADPDPDLDQASGDSNINDNKNYPPPPPSRYAFRMATAEIVSERSEAGATAFLARFDNDGITASGTAVGSAELSPIEFDGVIRRRSKNNNTDTDTDTDINSNPLLPSMPMLYVTDVVTSSRNRRMGIANALMEAVEQYAYETYGDGTALYLHVKPDNEAAQSFYTNPKRGYCCVPTIAATATATNPDQLKENIIDIDRLEKNSGTAGQMLFYKILNGSNAASARNINLTKSKTARQWGTQQNNAAVAVAVGTGFGGATIGKAKSSNKKSKRKKR